MAASPEEIQQIFRTELGRGADEEAVRHYVGTGLTGLDLVKSILHTAGKGSQLELFNDPAYAAFARTQRIRQAQLEAERAQRLSDIARQRQIMNLGFDRQRKQAVEDVNQGFANRGMYRSGARVAKLAEETQDLDLRRQTSELQFSGQEADINRTIADSIGELSRQRDEQEIAARNRITDRSIRDAQLAAEARRLQLAEQQQVQARQAGADAASSAAAAIARFRGRR